MPNHTPYSPQFIRQKRPNGTSKTSRDPAKTNNAGEVIMNPQSGTAMTTTPSFLYLKFKYLAARFFNYPYLLLQQKQEIDDAVRGGKEEADPIS